MPFAIPPAAFRTLPLALPSAPATVECGACDGEGRIFCRDAYDVPGASHVDDDIEGPIFCAPCETCDGRGEVECDSCDGSGKRYANDEDGSVLTFCGFCPRGIAAEQEQMRRDGWGCLVDAEPEALAAAMGVVEATDNESPSGPSLVRGAS